MFKYIGLSKRTHTLDHKRYTAIAEKQTGLTRVDVSMLAKADIATRHRLSRRQDVETAERLTQRLQDLALIRDYFQIQMDVTFLGMYGWGEGCQVSAAPGQGISEYDAIIYQKNGQIVVEKIGSCWQLFRQQARFSGKGPSDVITSGGDVFLLHPHFGGELSKKPLDVFFQDETRAMSPSVEKTAPRPGSSSAEVVHDPISEVEIQAPVASHFVPPGLRSPVENRRGKGRRALNSHFPESALCMSGEDFLTQLSKPSGCTSDSCTGANCKPGPHASQDALVVKTEVVCPFCSDATCSNQACQPILSGAVNPLLVKTTRRQAIPEGLDFFKKPSCSYSSCRDASCQPILSGAVNSLSVQTTRRQAQERGDSFRKSRYEDPLNQAPQTSCCTSASCTDAKFKPSPHAPKDALVVKTEEGCPCCLNAIDLDELAGLGKILNNTGEASHTSFELAQVDGSWGVAAGLAGPFAVLGLVAAYRNVTGAYATRQVLKAKLAEIEQLIKQEATPQRLAYRYCLQY